MTVTQEADYAEFVQKVKGATGIDLRLYKEGQMHRRLVTLSRRRGFPTFTSYYGAMVKSPELMSEFLDHMTINFSEFYRNPDRWEVLKDKILPTITSRKRTLQCWSAACSTGEEPYTLAMVLSESPGVSYKIMATDVDEGALARARNGEYLHTAVENVPKALFARYFTRSSDTKYKISRELINQVTFEKHNLLADPYQRGFDLIICRNVLIYFTDEAKGRVVHKFSESLSPNGYLFVGGTEHLSHPEKYGLRTSSEMFFYQKV